MKYVPIVVWSLVYNVLSMSLGMILTWMFKLPSWTTPAISFNNTTALPLLLIQSLETTGILRTLDDSSDVVAKAKSFFLVNAMIGDSLTFALGPKLLNGHEQDAPDEEEEKDNGDEEEEADDDAERGQVDGDTGSEDHEQATEDTSLLPDRVIRPLTKQVSKFNKKRDSIWNSFPSWLQSTLAFLEQFWCAPLVGAVIAAIIGLVPTLHRLFFNETNEGGYLNAWLTTSTKNVGDLFAVLQIVVVGVKLSQAMLKMKRGEASGTVPWLPMVMITTVRFVIWPLLSIPIIWALASKTDILPEDPLLWFAMMLMPCGPPALKLMALADVNGEEEEEKMSIAKFLTISYVVSPLICFTVVGALKASQAALESRSP